jgi:protein subunit release factor A
VWVYQRVLALLLYYGSMKPSSSAPDEPDFEQTLQEVERSLQALKARYAQVQADQQQQQDLQQRQTHIQRQLRQTRSRPLQAELKRIQKQLEELETALESQLFSWRGLKDLFWLALRFGGVGIIIGWLLKSLTV